MKWWGWGHPDVSFPMHERPKLWPWIENKLDAKQTIKDSIVGLDEIILDRPNLHSGFMQELSKILPSENMLTTHEERVVHSYGKSYPDLLRIRKGIIRKAPDLIIYPESHEQVLSIVQLAVKFNVKLIAFGGGTNIVGALEVKDLTAMNVSVDMRKMKRVLKIDKVSQRATIESGILGPELEIELNKQGYGLGHFPDSFEFSTLGGWIATRSAGMQSDEYGKIENMVCGLKIVSTNGESLFKSFPSTSAGPDLKQLFIGSEGAFGIITEATMKIHVLPEEKIAIGFLFPTFKDGLSSIIECYKKRITAAMIRLQDENETDLALHIKPAQSKLNDLLESPIKAYLKRTGYHRPAVMVIGLEGTKKEVAFKRRQIEKILKSHKAFPLGRKVEKSWARDKYNMPYLRDYIMDYSCLADVAETSASWAELENLYDTTVKNMTNLFADQKTKGYVGCHLSHSYEDGACLYFTYAVKQAKGKELEQYYHYKKFITDSFVKANGTLSHHHAVGYEHLPWLKEELGEFNTDLLQKIKTQFDPDNIFNPGSLDTNRKHPFIEAYKRPL